MCGSSVVLGASQSSYRTSRSGLLIIIKHVQDEAKTICVDFYFFQKGSVTIGGSGGILKIGQYHFFQLTVPLLRRTTDS